MGVAGGESIQVAWIRCASTERCGIARMHFVPMMSFEAVRMRCALAKRCGVVGVLRVDDGIRAGCPLRFLLFIGAMVANGVGPGAPVHGLNVGFSNAAHSDFPPLTHVNGVNPIDTNLLLICSSHSWFSA